MVPELWAGMPAALLQADRQFDERYRELMDSRRGEEQPRPVRSRNQPVRYSKGWVLAN